MATRTPFERVEISSSSAGSYAGVRDGCLVVFWGEELAFCMPWTTVARPLERYVGRTLGTNERLANARDEHFNMAMQREGGVGGFVV